MVFHDSQSLMTSWFTKSVKNTFFEYFHLGGGGSKIFLSGDKTQNSEIQKCWKTCIFALSNITYEGWMIKMCVFRHVLNYRYQSKNTETCWIYDDISRFWVDMGTQTVYISMKINLLTCNFAWSRTTTKCVFLWNTS